MAYFVKNNYISGESFVHVYRATSQADLEKNIEDCFSTLGYKVILKDNNVITYEKGSRTMRLLFGAFYKYNKINISLSTEGEDFVLTAMNASTGVSGGMIGVSQAKEELKRVAQALSCI